MTNKISESNSTGFVNLIVYPSVRTNSKQMALNVKSVSVITIVSIVLAVFGAILLFVHLFLSIKPVCSQRKIIWSNVIFSERERAFINHAYNDLRVSFSLSLSFGHSVTNQSSELSRVLVSYNWTKTLSLQLFLMTEILLRFLLEVTFHDDTRLMFIFNMSLRQHLYDVRTTLSPESKISYENVRTQAS